MVFVCDKNFRFGEYSFCLFCDCIHWWMCDKLSLITQSHNHEIAIFMLHPENKKKIYPKTSFFAKCTIINKRWPFTKIDWNHAKYLCLEFVSDWFGHTNYDRRLLFVATIVFWKGTILWWILKLKIEIVFVKMFDLHNPFPEWMFTNYRYHTQWHISPLFSLRIFEIRRSSYSQFFCSVYRHIVDC